MSFARGLGLLIFVLTGGIFLLEVSIHSGGPANNALRARARPALNLQQQNKQQQQEKDELSSLGEQKHTAEQQLVKVVLPQVIHRWRNANDSVIIVTPNGVTSAGDMHARQAAYALDTKRLTEFRTKKGMDLKALTFKDSADRYQAFGAAAVGKAKAATVEGQREKDSPTVSSVRQQFAIYRPVESECKEKIHADADDWQSVSESLRQDRLSECIKARDNSGKFLVDSCVILQYYFAFDPWARYSLGREKPRRRRRAFLEVGGLAGLPAQSMTLVFQRYFGYDAWDGMAVEATTANFAHLMYNRPCLYRAEIAAGKEWGHLDFTGWGGCCSGITADMAETNKRVFHGKNAQAYKVQSAPVTEILIAADFRTLDFWVLDVEGAELSVLLGMDFKKINVGMILVEVSGDKSTASQVHQLLVQNGFFLDTKHFHSMDNLNSLYINNSTEQWIMDRYNLPV